MLNKMNFIFNCSWTFSNILLRSVVFPFQSLMKRLKVFKLQIKTDLLDLLFPEFSILRIVISDQISFKNTSFYFWQKNFGCVNIVPKLIQNKIIQTLWDLAENWMKRNKDWKETFSRLKYIDTPGQRQVQRELFRKTFGRLSGSSGGKEK